MITSQAETPHKSWMQIKIVIQIQEQYRRKPLILRTIKLIIAVTSI
jgi:hypothetical protein